MGFGIVDQRRQAAGGGDDSDGFEPAAVFLDPADFPGATLSFLDDADAGGLLFEEAMATKPGGFVLSNGNNGSKIPKREQAKYKKRPVVS